MEQIVISVILSVIGASGFWSLVLYFFQRKDREKTLINESLLALLHDRVYGECVRILRNGEVTQDEYDNLLHLYEPYRDLGGNGVCERMMKAVDELGITPSR